MLGLSSTASRLLCVPPHGSGEGLGDGAAVSIAPKMRIIPKFGTVPNLTPSGRGAPAAPPNKPGYPAPTVRSPVGRIMFSGGFSPREDRGDRKTGPGHE